MGKEPYNQAKHEQFLESRYLTPQEKQLMKGANFGPPRQIFNQSELNPHAHLSERASPDREKVRSLF